MANIKSAKKRAIQSVKRRQKNLSRKTGLKTAIRKVLDAIKANDYESSMTLFKDAQAKLARAKGKHVIHANAAARKTGRLAQKIAKLVQKEQPAKQAAAK